MSLPSVMFLMSKVITITGEEGLHSPASDAEEGDTHPHKVYGVYDEASESISIDTGVSLSRQQTTLMHEALHAMLGITALDTIMDSQAGSGFSEHVVTALAPVMLCWLRENYGVHQFLVEEQA